MRVKWRPVVIGVAVAATVSFIYFPALRYGYLNFDDNVNIYENPHLRPVNSETWRYFWTRTYADLYIPVTYSVWAGLAGLARLIEGAAPRSCPGAAYFHGLNIVIHVANSILVFLLLRQLLVRTKLFEKKLNWTARRDAAAGLGALLFALHPVQVESVIWITALKDLLSCFFALLSLGQYVSWRSHPARGRGRLAAAASLYLLAVLAKPSAVILPLIVVILDFAVLRIQLRRSFAALSWWVIPVIPIIVLTKFSQPDNVIRFVPSLGLRFLVAADALIFYLGKIILPVRLAVDYGRSPGQVLEGGGLRLFLPLLLVAGLGVLLLFRKLRGGAAATLLIAVFAILPVSGLIPFRFQDFSTVADRYLYLAILGPALFIAWQLSRFRHPTLPIAIGFVICFFAVGSVVQISHWRDVTAVYRRAIRINPQSAFAHNNLGNYFVRRGEIKAGVPYRRSRSRIPDSAQLLSPRKRQELALSHYLRALAIDPDYADARNNCGYILFELGRTEEALAQYRRAIGIDPGNARAHLNLANAFSFLGQLEGAVRHYRKALDIDPGYAKAHYNLALFYHRQMLISEALSHYSAALRAEPDFPEARHNRRVLLESISVSGESAAVFRPSELSDQPARGE